MNNTNKEVRILPPFKRLCMTIGELPTSYVESMTYYESLLWFTKYLHDTVIPAINNNGEAVKELQEKYIELKNYVDTYFDNLDLQTEVNNKLDDMAEQGELANLITIYLQMSCILSYDSLDDLLADTNLHDDQNVRTLGYHNLNDGGGSLFKIREASESEEANNITTYETTNGLIAEIIDNSNELYAKKYGVKCDKVSDDSIRLQTIINYCKTAGKTLIIDGYAYVSSTINTKGVLIKGIGKTIEPGYTYKSKEYGNIGWTYLKNIGEGALITFNDYVDDNLVTGSGIISDTANPILSVTSPDARFNLENLTICGWLRTANQVGIKNIYDISNPPQYIYGEHKFKNISVINCGGNGIELTNLETTVVDNLISKLNFGYGIYINASNTIDTPTEYVKFTNSKICGNKLGGIYINKGFNKQLTFDNCDFSASGLYEELSREIPENTYDMSAGIEINGFKNNQNNLTIENCYAERLELFVKIMTYSTSPLHTFNSIRIFNNIMYPLNSSGSLVYYDNYYSNGFEFYNNFISQGIKFNITDRSKSQLIPFNCDASLLPKIEMMPQLSFNENLNVTSNNCYRYGNLIYIGISATATDDIAAWQTLVSNFPKPKSDSIITMVHSGTTEYSSWFTNRVASSGHAIANGDTITFLGVYYVDPYTNKDGNY